MLKLQVARLRKTVVNGRFSVKEKLTRIAKEDVVVRLKALYRQSSIGLGST
jgi:hypothetical protein